MLAYAASRPVVVDRRPYPNAMLMIIGAHVAVAALVMSAKMEIPIHPSGGPIIVHLITTPKPPPPRPTPHPAPPRPGPITWHDPAPLPLPYLPFPTPRGADPTPPSGPGPIVIPEPVPTPKPTGVSSGPQLLTPTSELKPPYPASKLLNEEQAVLRLRLTIDGNGRVVAVDPIGRTDPVFLDAARRYLIAHWRYKPALENGRTIASSASITLRFQLDG